MSGDVIGHFAAPMRSTRPFEIVGVGDLPVGRLAGHDDDTATRTPPRARRRRWPSRPGRGRRAARRHGTPAGSAPRPGVVAVRASPATVAVPSTTLIVSVTAIAGNRRRRHRRGPRRSPRVQLGVASGRAASCTQMIVASAGTAARPARTDSLRVDPPATPRSRSTSAAGTTTTTPSDARSATGRDGRSRRRSPSSSYCFAAPNRSPVPPRHHDRPHELRT